MATRHTPSGRECTPTTTRRRSGESTLNAAQQRDSNPVAFVQKGFRRDVVERPHLTVAQHARRLGTHASRDPKVDQLQTPSNEQKVGRLQVAVDDARLVDRVHRLQHLLPEEPHRVHVD